MKEKNESRKHFLVLYHFRIALRISLMQPAMSTLVAHCGQRQNKIG